MKFKSLKIILTTTFTVPGPTVDELTELALDVGIEGTDPTEEELGQAYEDWKEQVTGKYEEGEENPPDGARSDIEIEEVDL